MSPILVRPVREQFEHDRVIRVLQAKYKRKYEVAINPGAEQNASVGVGDLAMYPDLVLFSMERSRKLQGTVEVETTESINTLEAMAEWAQFSKLHAPFFLYVPANSIDTVRRLCTEHSIAPAEIWTYHAAIDQVRFTMVHRSPDAPKIPEPRAKTEPPRADKPKVDQPRVDKPKPEKARVESRKAKAEVKKASAKAAKTAPKARTVTAARPVKPAAKAKKKAAPKKRR